MKNKSLIINLLTVFLIISNWSYYNKGMANIAAAATVSQITEYEKVNDLLDISLYNLYTLMLDTAFRD